MNYTNALFNETQSKIANQIFAENVGHPTICSHIKSLIEPTIANFFVDMFSPDIYDYLIYAFAGRKNTMAKTINLIPASMNFQQDGNFVITNNGNFTTTKPVTLFRSVSELLQ